MLKLSHKNPEICKIVLQPVKEVYDLTKSFPKEEQYVLVGQLRRTAISVCSNIAEGSAGSSKPDRKRFYEISRSSLAEIDTQFEIVLILEYLRDNHVKQPEDYLGSVFRMISKMISNLSAWPTHHSPQRNTSSSRKNSGSLFL